MSSHDAEFETDDEPQKRCVEDLERDLSGLRELLAEVYDNVVKSRNYSTSFSHHIMALFI
jgi:hypothetical protein